MSRKRRQPNADDPEFVADLNERILRLREMLALMAPETGSSALGASFSGYQQGPRDSQVLLLPSPDAANL
jgi:hypothetical protein